MTDDAPAPTAALTFLESLFTASPEGHLCLLVKAASGGGLSEQWLEWPTQRDEVAATVDGAAVAERDVYFVPYLFDQPILSTSNILPSNVVRVDLDNADMILVGTPPTYLVETSPNRRQGYWLLTKRNVDADTGAVTAGPECLPVDALESLARNLAYSIPNADRTTWPLATPMRLPGTTSFKYLAEHAITLTANTVVHTLADLELVPDPPFLYTDEQMAFISNPPAPDTLKAKGPLSLIELLHGETPPKIDRRWMAQYRVKKPPSQLASIEWEFILHLVRNGANRTDIFWLVKLWDNNPYQSFKFNADREICKDILRAEAITSNSKKDTRAAVNEMRNKTEGPRYMRMDQLKNIVIENMRAEGDFIKTSDAETYYIRRDRGRPIPIGHGSPQFTAMLDVQYGLNAAETEHGYVSKGIISWARESLTINGLEKALTYFDKDLNNLFIHTGRRDVYRVDPDKIERVVDGAYNVVFPWQTGVQPFRIDFTELERPWWQILVADALPTVINMEHKQATALVTAWVMFLFLRDMAPSRPILAMFGQPGSGKTTFYKRIFNIMYGPDKALNGVTTAQNFDHAMSTEALVVLDNADETNKWFLDRMAQSSSKMDVPVREYYTNLGTVIQKRHAMLAISAHKAEYNRPDIADRLLIVMLERFEGKLSGFTDEAGMMAKLTAIRPQIWGSIIRDFQAVIKSPMPLPGDTPAFRIKDFAVIGVWCLRAIDERYGTNMIKDFESAITSLGYSQRAFALEDESMLIAAAKHWLENTVKRDPVATHSEWLRPRELFAKLCLYSGDQENFKLQYANESRLSRHLVSVQRSMEDVVKFERALSNKVGITGQPNYVWRVGPPASRNGATNNGH